VQLRSINLCQDELVCVQTVIDGNAVAVGSQYHLMLVDTRAETAMHIGVPDSSGMLGLSLLSPPLPLSLSPLVVFYVFDQPTVCCCSGCCVAAVDRQVFDR
jgi:hypothetical protein